MSEIVDVTPVLEFLEKRRDLCGALARRAPDGNDHYVSEEAIYAGYVAAIAALTKKNTRLEKQVEALKEMIRAIPEISIGYSGIRRRLYVEGTEALARATDAYVAEFGTVGRGNSA